MNFFEAQEQAKQRSTRLIVLFCVAVVLIVLTVYLAVSLGFVIYAVGSDGVADWWSWTRFWMTLVITVGFIAIGSLVKSSELSGGGRVVARMLGGRLVDGSNRNPLHRRLYNVVEEMALASGVPVPEVYVLEHQYRINAFAAGFTMDDAVVAVTQGALQALSRDELQGVVAHEFSHILNGDMRLNTRLIAVLHGILMLTLLGRILQSDEDSASGFYARPRLSGRRMGGGVRGGGGGQAGLAIVAVLIVAVLVTVIGYVGAFFARWIQGCVLRQREYLADASALQFTRNPDGIGGALKKVGGLFNGSYVSASRTEDATHLFFSNPLFSGSKLDSGRHPPLAERIRRVDPHWDGTYPKVERPRPQRVEEEQPGMRGVSPDFLTAGVLAGGLLSRAAPADLSALVAASGRTASDRLSPDLKAAAHDPARARELMLALLMAPEEAARQAQLAQIAGSPAGLDAAVAGALCGPVAALNDEDRLALLDITVPALKDVSEMEFQELARLIDTLIRWDHRTTGFEFLVRRAFLQQVGPKAGSDKVDTGDVVFKDIRQIAGSISVLLSLMAREASKSTNMARTKLEQAVKQSYILNGHVAFIEDAELDFERADRALDEIRHTTFAIRRHVVEAATQCAALGEKPTPSELGLLRIFSRTLGCPIPRT